MIEYKNLILMKRNRGLQICDRADDLSRFQVSPKIAIAADDQNPRMLAARGQD